MQNILTIIIFLFGLNTWAKEVTVKMYFTDGNRQPNQIGVIIAQDTEYGLLIIPSLKLLKQGYYGLHVHEKPNCGKLGKAAGGHFDPKNTSLHLGPYSKLGHLGDLPNILVDSKGESTIPILAPRLVVEDIIDRTLIIHSKSDSYDQESFINSGERVACGVVPKTYS